MKCIWGSGSERIESNDYLNLIRQLAVDLSGICYSGDANFSHDVEFIGAWIMEIPVVMIVLGDIQRNLAIFAPTSIRLDIWIWKCVIP